MRSGQPEQGQATVDYVALVALFALLLAAAAAVVGIGAPGTANAVLAQFHRALCIVTGDSCEVERPRPCAVASTRDTRHWAVNAFVFRYDNDRYVLLERLSDGKLRLTVTKRDSGGLELGVGVRAVISKDGRTVGGADELGVGVQGLYGRGEVYRADDDREAGAILRAIRGSGDRLPPPREIFYEGGIRMLGKLGVSALIAGAGLDTASEQIVGMREDRDAGTRTFYMNFGGSANMLAQLLLSGPAATISSQVVMAVTLDREGRPAELSLSGGAATASGSARPGNQRQEGKRVEFAARVSLSDPEVAAAWTAFRRTPAQASAVVALAERLRARAHLDVRAYATDSSSHGGTAVRVSPILRFGGERADTVEAAKLESALTRPPGGLWEPRLDCVAVA